MLTPCEVLGYLYSPRTALAPTTSDLQLPLRTASSALTPRVLRFEIYPYLLVIKRGRHKDYLQNFFILTGAYVVIGEDIRRISGEDTVLHSNMPLPVVRIQLQGMLIGILELGPWFPWASSSSYVCFTKIRNNVYLNTSPKRILEKIVSPFSYGMFDYLSQEEQRKYFC
ncbi:hypothetical protein J6590_081468 [Homalodisca vitripennis]|nr:hypothetical protein J6590_081468 [Homalodisca vitripennis]